jgi:TonB-linked SusC/RagA family outer membrane protein
MLVRRMSRPFAWFAAIVAMPACVHAQQRVTISGRVTSDSGVPIRDASVFEEGKIGSVATGNDGRYTITVTIASELRPSLMLTARRVGYRQITKPVTLTAVATSVDFALSPLPHQLSEVVVTGEGTTTMRQKLGSTVSSVDGEDIVSTHEPNLVNALAAQASNVEVTSQSGDPGAGASILIRGFKSIEGTGQPLFIVDGSPVNNDAQSTTGDPSFGTVTTNRVADINPNDVESIEVLKGAAAASIYGTRAAQGVVLITTKGGKAGATRYELHTSVSFDNVTKGIPLQRAYGQGDDGTAAICDGPGCTLTPDSWGPLLPAGTPTYDHFGELFHTGHLLDANLDISGGDERRSFFLSVGRMNHDGTILGPDSHLDRTSIRLKGAQALGSQLRLSGNVAYAKSLGGFVEHGNNTDGLMLSAARTAPEFDNREYLDPENGQHRSYIYPEPIDITAPRRFSNPFWMIHNDLATSDLSRTFGNLNLEYAPAPWLSVKYWLGLDQYSDNRLEGFPVSSSVRSSGLVIQGTYTNIELDHNLIIAASRTFSPSFAANLTLGQNLNSRHFQRIQDVGTDLVGSVLAMSAATNVNSANNETLVHSQSYFAQLGLDLWDQLYLLGALRDDGSSTFGRDDPHSLFPKVSAAWNAARLIGEHSWLPFVKLRIAYGEAGREPDPYQILTGYDPAIFAGNGGLVTSFTKGQDSLRPERTKELEAGIDFGLFRGYSDGSITYYHSRTSDAIFATPLPQSSGFGQQEQNAATIENRGWELALNLHSLQGPALRWDVGLTWAHNANRVLSLRGVSEIPFFDSDLFESAVLPGYSIGTFYLPDFVRCRYGQANVRFDESGTATDINAYCKAHGAPNGALFVDASGYPIRDNDTSYVVGRSTPDWTGSVRTAITLFRKLQISALLDVRHGGQIWNGTRGALYNFGTHKDTERRDVPGVIGTDVLRGPVVGPGAGNTVDLGQNWFAGLGSVFNGPDAQFLEAGGYTKLREVSIAYTWSGTFVRRTLSLSSVELRLAGRNLHTWSSYRGLDPETSSAGPAAPGGGIDYFNNPQTRSLVISVGLFR